jgi:hypothetical protein
LSSAITSTRPPQETKASLMLCGAWLRRVTLSSDQSPSHSCSCVYQFPGCCVSPVPSHLHPIRLSLAPFCSTSPCIRPWLREVLPHMLFVCTPCNTIGDSRRTLLLFASLAMDRVGPLAASQVRPRRRILAARHSERGVRTRQEAAAQPCARADGELRRWRLRHGRLNLYRCPRRPGRCIPRQVCPTSDCCHSCNARLMPPSS